MTSELTEKQPTDLENDYSVKFLLAEYERLRDVRAEIIHRATRRFEFYLTITTAITGGFILLAQVQGGLEIPLYIIDLIALGLFVYGMVTFINITFSSTFDLQIIRAFKEIQKYFTDRNPEIENYLYFSSPPTVSNRYRFTGVLVRGMGGGSEKSLITLINSALITYLVISLLNSHIQAELSGGGLIFVAIIIFVISGLSHVFYVTYMYRFSGEKQ